MYVDDEGHVTTYEVVGAEGTVWPHLLHIEQQAREAGGTVFAWREDMLQRGVLLCPPKGAIPRVIQELCNLATAIQPGVAIHDNTVILLQCPPGLVQTVIKAAGIEHWISEKCPPTRLAVDSAWRGRLVHATIGHDLQWLVTQTGHATPCQTVIHAVQQQAGVRVQAQHTEAFHPGSKSHQPMILSPPKSPTGSAWRGSSGLRADLRWRDRRTQLYPSPFLNRRRDRQPEQQTTLKRNPLSRPRFTTQSKRRLAGAADAAITSNWSPPLRRLTLRAKPSVTKRPSSFQQAQYGTAGHAPIADATLNRASGPPSMSPKRKENPA